MRLEARLQPARSGPGRQAGPATTSRSRTLCPAQGPSRRDRKAKPPVTAANAGCFAGRTTHLPFGHGYGAPHRTRRSCCRKDANVHVFDLD